jgi:hypothetical protein
MLTCVFVGRPSLLPGPVFSTSFNGTKQLLGVAAVDVQLASLNDVLKSLDASLLGKGVAGEGSGIILLAQRLVVSTTLLSRSVRSYKLAYPNYMQSKCLWSDMLMPLSVCSGFFITVWAGCAGWFGYHFQPHGRCAVYRTASIDCSRLECASTGF